MADRQDLTERDRRGDEEENESSSPRGLQEDQQADGHSDGRDGGKSDKQDKKPRPPKEKKKRPLVRIILILAVIAAVIGGVWYWWSTKDIEDTDDAYTDGHVVTIAPRVAGQVLTLNVRDNQLVRQGDLLIQIDPRDYEAARDQALGNLQNLKGQLAAAQYGSEVARKNFPAQLAQAQAQVAVAKANLFKAQTDYQRQHNLPRAATTQQEVDAATAALQQAQAQVQLAEAQVQQAQPVPQSIGQVEARVGQLEGLVKQGQADLDRANLNLSWTRVVAPQDGWVTRRNVEAGNYVQPGQSIMALVTPDVWVTANFKEAQLDRMRPGQQVDIAVDAYPDLKLTGHVDSIQLGSGSRFSAFPAENATGNFVKIVQRVPVKIVIDSGLDPNRPLPVGLSVEPTVKLK